MERNEVEARRAMEIAERKLLENDYYGAKKLVKQAQNLYPKLNGLKQVLIITDVYISASNGGRREADWYGILGIDRLVDDETVKKQYKKLALLLHPDKNKFSGAEGAFKLVLEAWRRLSKPEPKSNNKRKTKHKHKPKPKTKPEPEPEPTVETTFWTVCNRCKTYREFVRAGYLNKTLSCQNCGEDFVAAEIVPEIINGRPLIRLSPSDLSTRKRTSDTSSSSSSANQAHKRVKRWFEPKLDEFDSSLSRKEIANTYKFWTVCNRCKTYCRFVRATYLNKTLPCPTCGQDFVATEIIPEIINGSPVIRLISSNFQPTSKSRFKAYF
ncbi:hypothetical protein EUTSA_v10012364mg [Eutrema salsugineum]|uniref:J domain-containing protein n=1 Tax=Eutrema salsugineum TaxID=72664 RepID=V4MI35_EUTSA|nr:hypothetical protein EUTSA_v10012364mg [Eutrema salsugineum]